MSSKINKDAIEYLKNRFYFWDWDLAISLKTPRNLILREWKKAKQKGYI
jgi:hypothetical protein